MFEKKGEMKIGFGMIFSIFLIIAFIAFAIYGVSKFLCVNKMAQIESFRNDFQNDINRAYKSSHISQSVSYTLPKKIKQVCFIDDGYSNVYFVPKDIGCQIEGEMMIKNIDITKTISDSRTRPKKLCIDTASGKITMTIKKSHNEAYVTITK